MGLYEFQKEDAIRFKNFIGATAKDHGKQMVFWKCPYCNGGAHRDKETFAINTDNGTFNCKRASCGVKGNMITLAKDFNFELSSDVSRYFETHDFRKGRFRSFKKPKKIEPKDKAIEFMESRGISRAICERYEITTKQNNDSIIVFPFRDGTGEMVFIKYRNTDPERIEQYGKEFTEKNCKPILYGMYQCNLENPTLILTEGQIDSLSVAECGIENAVSVPTGATGFTWIPHCWDWLQSFSRIVVFGDHENDQITLLETIRQRFSKTKQILHVRPEDYKDCKDANDILRKYGKKQVIACINNAIPVPVECLVDMADVAEVNPEDIKRIPTGVIPLDNLLGGGLPVGMVSGLNGKTGEGKSTFASQTICAAIASGHTVMIYSGEMTKENVKSQLMLQLAGPDFVENYDGTGGHQRARVQKRIYPKINEWLRGKAYIYDSTIVQDGSEYDELLKVVEKSIQQYGVDYVVIDNLMTAIDLVQTRSDSKYDRQGDFVNQLARITLDYNIAILLIAHRRKSGAYQVNENDETLGSSQVTNLLGVNIFYGRETDKKKAEKLRIANEDRIIKVTKERVMGATNFDGIVVNFDKASRRIYHNAKESELNVNYGWSTEEDEWTEDIDKWEIPF